MRTDPRLPGRPEADSPKVGSEPSIRVRGCAGPAPSQPQEAAHTEPRH